MKLSSVLPVAWLILFGCVSQLTAQTIDDLQRQLTEQQRLIEQQHQRLQRLEGLESSFPVGHTALPSLQSAFTPPCDCQSSSDCAATPQDGLQFGFARGFFIASPEGIVRDDAHADYLLRVGSRMQLRHTFFDSAGANRDQNDFEFERLRLVFDGHVYTPSLKYFVQLDADSDGGENVDFLDYFISYDFGREVFGQDAGRLGFRAGKWKLPFNRTRRESGFKLEFADRSLASSFFDINRSIGVGCYGKLPLLQTDWNWETAFFNGFNSMNLRPVRTGEQDRNPGVSGRIFADLMGNWGTDGEADLEQKVSPAVRVGSGFAYTRVDREGLLEFFSQRVVDSGRPLALLLPAGVVAYDIFFAACDANLKYRGLSIHSEYYWRRISNYSPGQADDLLDHGFLVQSGYFLIAKRFELAMRYSRIVGNSGTLGGRNRSADEIAGAAIVYLKGHFVKLTFDVTHLNGAPIADRALNILPGDDGMLYRTQLQFWF